MAADAAGLHISAHRPEARERGRDGGRADILKPIWSSKPAAARVVHQRIGAVMKWAVAKGYRPDNPAGDAIAAALARNGNATRHHQALRHGEVSAALAESATRGPMPVSGWRSSSWS